MLRTTVERTLTLPGNARLILGAEWNSAKKTLTIFEGTESRLTVLDSLGQVVGTVGRRGDGPGEFRLSPIYVGSRQKFRTADEGRVLVLDDRYGHVFTRGRETQDVRFGDAAAVLATDAHVARIRGGWIVSMAHRGVDPAATSLVRLFLVRDTAGAQQSARLLATVKNVTSQAPLTTGAPADMPYDRLFRRTWDASGPAMAVTSFHHFAVCTGNVADSTSWRAWATKAAPRRVTATERDRVLTERFGATSGPIPMMGGRVEDYYRGKWPETAPFYHDITALNDSTYAALRLDDDGGISADLFATARGYRGSIKLPAARGIIGGYAGGLLLLNFADGEIEFLRIVGPV